MLLEMSAKRYIYKNIKQKAFNFLNSEEIITSVFSL